MGARMTWQWILTFHPFAAAHKHNGISSRNLCKDRHQWLEIFCQQQSSLVDLPTAKRWIVVTPYIMEKQQKTILTSMNFDCLSNLLNGKTGSSCFSTGFSLSRLRDSSKNFAKSPNFFSFVVCSIIVFLLGSVLGSLMFALFPSCVSFSLLLPFSSLKLRRKLWTTVLFGWYNLELNADRIEFLIK